jgi:hypothetical protein
MNIFVAENRILKAQLNTRLGIVKSAAGMMQWVHEDYYPTFTFLSRLPFSSRDYRSLHMAVLPVLSEFS